MSWNNVVLKDVATVSAGNSAPQEDALFLDGVHNFYRTSDIGKIRKGYISDSTDKLNENGIKGLKLFKKGTILFPKSGASTFLNHRVMMMKEGYVSSHLAAIKANEKLLNDKFLLYYLTTVDAKSLVQDSNYPSLKTTSIEKIQLSLPSLPTQQKIVEKLDAIFAEIERATMATEANVKNAEALFQSYLKEVFERGGEDWYNTTLGKICELAYGKGLVDKDRNVNGEYVAYGANGPKARTNKFLYDKQSIVIGRKGSAGELTRVNDKFWALDVCYYVTHDENKINIDFLYFLLLSKNLPSLAKGVKPGINRNEVYSLTAKYPALQKQIEAANKLENLREQISNLVKLKELISEEYLALKQSILKQAFNGELVKE